MKQFVTIALLAAAIAAQQPCSDFRLETVWRPAELHHHSLHAFGWQHAELVPTANGVGLLLFYYMPEYSMWYSDFHTWVEDVPGCQSMRFRNLALWWDDTSNSPRHDLLQLGSGREVSLQSLPIGLVWATQSAPLPLQPRVIRQQEPWHWNSLLYRPLYWAVLIVPEGGQW